MKHQASAMVAVLFLVVIVAVMWVLQDLHRGPLSVRQDCVLDREKSAHRTIVAYLNALERQDRSVVQGFAPPGNDAGKDADDRLRRFAGARAARADISITGDLSPDVLSARIHTIGTDSQELTWTENLFWQDGSWRIVMGVAPHADHLGPPSSIERPR
jgi:hypothetical protein